MTGDAPISREQLWWAAALTAPGRVLSHASAGARYGFRPWVAGYEVVTAPGSGGPRRHGAVLVCRSQTLALNTTHLDGPPITTAERAPARPLVGPCAPAVTRRARRAVRPPAGYPTPLVNHTIAGHTPDLAWPHARHIVELDGPDFHQFPDEDLRKQARWERAGWTVARLPTADVYDRPERLLLAAEPALRRGSAFSPRRAGGTASRRSGPTCRPSSACAG